jgi:signal recognition particle receptor subunit beta
MVQEDELKSCPMLVFANKQDLPNALPVATISTDLGDYTLINNTVILYIAIRIEKIRFY